MTTVKDPVLSLVGRDDLRVLHVPCGSGDLGRSLKTGDRARIVWGMEPDLPKAGIARGHLDRVLCGNPEAPGTWSFQRGFFDCVILDGCLAGLADPVRFLRMVKSGLSPHGRVIVRSPNPGHWSVIRSLIRGEGLRFRLQDRPVREMFFEAGYRIAMDLRGEDRDQEAVDTLAIAAQGFGVPVDRARSELELAETIHVIEPLRPVVDHRTAGTLGKATLKGCSVIVLTYNSRGTIGACLGSVLDTLGPEDELIVVDNASEDGTTELIESGFDPSKIVLIRNDTNLGFSSGCNVGIRASKGSFICLLNPDTEVAPGWLEGMEAHFKDPLVGMVGPLSDNVAGMQFVGHWLEPGEGSVDRIMRTCSSRYKGRSVATRLVIGLCAMLRRETLNEVGLLDEDLFLGSEDLELSWRLRTHGLKLLVAQDVFVRHLGGQSFASRPRPEIDRLLYQSTEAMLAKITAAQGWRPPDRLLWGLDICHR